MACESLSMASERRESNELSTHQKRHESSLRAKTKTALEEENPKP